YLWLDVSIPNPFTNPPTVSTSSSGKTASVHPFGLSAAVSCPILTWGSTRTVCFSSLISNISIIFRYIFRLVSLYFAITSLIANHPDLPVVNISGQPSFCQLSNCSCTLMTRLSCFLGAVLSQKEIFFLVFKKSSY